MSNKFFCLFILFILSLTSKAQAYDKTCYYGFAFEMSQNPSWGYGELVITSVDPNSPAEKAGIKVGDIIMEINGKATYLRDNQTIADLLFSEHSAVANFTIRNMNTYFKEYEFIRNCISTNSVSEKELSSIFSFYSLENTSQRSFTLPLTVTPNHNVDYSDYHSYDIYLDSKNSTPIDAQITALLEKDLQSKGLVRDTKDPDIVVQIYYNYQPNPKYTGLYNPKNIIRTWRYDTEKQQMTALPVFEKNEKYIQTLSPYIIEFGFSFYDRKYIDSAQLTQIWDCNIKDYLATQYSLEEYVRIHTPLMLMQFPYSEARTEAKYSVDFSKYNYTGLYFDAENLSTVTDVDQNSPAFAAGIREGYIVKKINNRKFDHNKKKLSEGYKQFISETMVFRNPETKFTDSQGYNDCMYWNVGNYAEIVKEFNKTQYLTSFSYLYAFEKYITNKPTNILSINAWDGRQNRDFEVRPQIRKSVVVKAL